VRLGILGGACQIALYPDSRLSSQPEDFWEPFGRCQLCGAPLRVFRFTLQGFMNQSIVGLSPLSETA
jgi:hypothetical protein